jgi:hypothetical protein
MILCLRVWILEFGKASWRCRVEICFCNNEYAHSSRGIVGGHSTHQSVPDLWKMSHRELSSTEILGGVPVIGGRNKVITMRRCSKLENLKYTVLS